MIVGYVLKRFPQLSASFVRNEIRMLEARGVSVSVFTVESPRPHDAAFEDIATDGDRSRPVTTFAAVRKRSLIAALAGAFWRHPIRLLRTIVLLIGCGSAETWTFFGKALMMLPAMRAARLNHVHAHMRVGSDLAWLIHRLTGWRFTFTAHAYDIYVGNRNLREKLADAGLVLTVCAFNRAKLIELYPPAAHKIHLLLPFLDRRLFTGQDRPLAREHIYLKLLCVCRLIPKKGVNVLIDAIARARWRGIPLRLTIVGEGKERDRLDDQVRRLGLSGVVSLLGARSATEVHAQMMAADCFALASVRTPDGDSDATPTVIGEAMVRGLPIIAARVAGIPEIVPPDAGLLVESNNAEAFAEAIAAMASMPPAQRKAMGDQGRRFVETSWNPERDVDRLIDLFRQCSKA